jgi:hypothetical protein
MSHIQRIACTAMFIAEGIHDAGYDKAIQAAHDLGEGWAETLFDIAKYATIIDDAAEAEVAAGAEYPGVFDYEVSVPFGTWYAETLIGSGDLSQAEDKARNLVHQFFHR